MNTITDPENTHGLDSCLSRRVVQQAEARAGGREDRGKRIAYERAQKELARLDSYFDRIRNLVMSAYRISPEEGQRVLENVCQGIEQDILERHAPDDVPTRTA